MYQIPKIATKCILLVFYDLTYPFQYELCLFLLPHWILYSTFAVAPFIHLPAANF